MTAWMDSGACRDKPVVWWFPERDGHRGFDAFARGRVVCASCPVVAACLDYAIEQDEQHGMWGGKSPTERKWIRRRKHPRGGRTGRPPKLTPEQEQEAREIVRESGVLWQAALRFGVSKSTIRRIAS